jgi:hypothetical protein
MKNRIKLAALFFAFFLVSILFLTLMPAHSSIGVNPKFKGWATDGTPLAGGLLYTYKPGTTTAKSAYTDSSLATPAANPVVLDSYGEASIYFKGAYKLVLKTSTGVTLWTVDNATGIGGSLQVSASDYGGLNSAITALGSTTCELVVDAADALTASATVPATMALKIVKGGVVTTTGYTLTFIGQLDAGPYQVFSGTGTVTGLKKVKPEWFGADPTGTVDSAAAMAKALAAIEANGGILEVDGVYDCGATGINFAQDAVDTAHSWVIEGIGLKKSTIKTTNAPIGLDLGGRDNVTLKNIYVRDVGTTAKVGIARYRSLYGTSDGGGHFHKYYDVLVEGSYSIACLYSVGSEVNAHYNIQLINGGTGSGYVTGVSDFRSLSAAGSPIDGGSNTVNNFYGGMIWTAEAAVYTSSSIIDNLNFFGTYLASDSYGVYLGDDGTKSVQGKIVFDGVRFEGQTAIGIYLNANTVWGLRVINSHFGQTSGYDIYQPDLTGGDGLVDAWIEGNWHSAQGIRLENGGKSCHIVVPQNESSTTPPVYLTNGGVFSNSYFEAPAISNSSAPGPGMVEVVHSDAFPWRMRLGPTDPDASYGTSATWGSSIVNRPSGAAPLTPEVGQSVTADNANWDPLGAGATGIPYPVFYDGANFVGMTPVPGTIAAANSSGKRGTVVYDTSYLYFCVATDTWKRIAWPAW